MHKLNLMKKLENQIDDLEKELHFKTDQFKKPLQLYFSYYSKINDILKSIRKKEDLDYTQKIEKIHSDLFLLNADVIKELESIKNES